MSEVVEHVEEQIADENNSKVDDEPKVDYAAEYKRQTGKDFVTGEYVFQ